MGGLGMRWLIEWAHLLELLLLFLGLCCVAFVIYKVILLVA